MPIHFPASHALEYSLHFALCLFMGANVCTPGFHLSSQHSFPKFKNKIICSPQLYLGSSRQLYLFAIFLESLGNISSADFLEDEFCSIFFLLMRVNCPKPCVPPSDQLPIVEFLRDLRCLASLGRPHGLVVLSIRLLNLHHILLQLITLHFLLHHNFLLLPYFDSISLYFPEIKV